MSGLQRAWLRRGPLAGLLWPVSLVYRAGSALHGRLYASGRRRVERLPVPVIVVGNVIAGGAGKTPVVLAILQHLRRRRLRAGVVSRGHGRSSRDCREVRPQDDPAVTGDEPLLLRRNGGLPVFVARRRAQAARALLAAYPATQVIVSDDGLQHHALARDIEICVFDRRGIGNGLLLPAGPLREPWPRTVDLVLRDADTPGIEGHVLRRTLAAEALRGDGARRSLADLRGVPVIALAGIASPEAFFAMLRAAGLTLAASYALPDHHDFVHLPAAIPKDATLLCTEKDAVKLWQLRPDAWAVPLQVEIPAAFWQDLDRLLDARLSSRHGSPPA
ncbi:tetraacyldisaccharide 4'-kinase [Ramlibacter sp. AN1133]|uniref:tetraacyldisaccharide 4'-kinase n=1 Tax=Ramlibacter sp. AN1133 TaxID=3133429 RepID=UPI0030C63917